MGSAALVFVVINDVVVPGAWGREGPRPPGLGPSPEEAAIDVVVPGAWGPVGPRPPGLGPAEEAPPAV